MAEHGFMYMQEIAASYTVHCFCGLTFTADTMNGATKKLTTHTVELEK